MTIKELKEILDTFDENKEAFFFCEECSSLNEITSVSDNNGHAQLNAGCEENRTYVVSKGEQEISCSFAFVAEQNEGGLFDLCKGNSEIKHNSLFDEDVIETSDYEEAKNAFNALSVYSEYNKSTGIATVQYAELVEITLDEDGEYESETVLERKIERIYEARKA